MIADLIDLLDGVRGTLADVIGVYSDAEDIGLTETGTTVALLAAKAALQAAEADIKRRISYAS